MKKYSNLVYMAMICSWASFSAEAARGAPLVELQTLKINQKEVQLIHHTTQHLLVSTHCLIQKNNNWTRNENCEAIKKLKNASLHGLHRLHGLKNALAGGANPGAIVCLQLGGRSLVSLDSKSNQNNVCQFADGSIISSGTLHYHARQNDDKNS